MVDPNSPVYTIADKDKAPYATVTFEKGIGFILGSDTYVNGHYEALIHMLKAGEWSTSQPVWGNLGQEKDVPLDYKKAAELYEAGKKLAYPKNKEDYDALPSGALYLDPGDGLIYQRKKH